MNRFVYLDNNSTTRISDSVYSAIEPYIKLNFGNPSNIYLFGKNVNELINDHRKKIASLLNVDYKNIVFNSGGSEGNITALNSAIKRLKNKKEIITTSIEHASILEHCKLLEKDGYKIIYLPVDNNGLIDLKILESSIQENTAIISIQLANNETGVIQPYKEITEIINKKKKDFDFEFHMDCVQALGKIVLPQEIFNADYLSFSAHKIQALKGNGFLYVKNAQTFVPLISGHQENNLRGGTENVIGIISMGTACEEFFDLVPKLTEQKELHTYFENQLKEKFDITINGESTNRLSNTTSLTFKNINGNLLMLKLERYGCIVSTGSACNAFDSQPSHVLTAMKIQNPENTIRISINSTVTKSKIDYFIEMLNTVLKEI